MEHRGRRDRGRPPVRGLARLLGACLAAALVGCASKAAPSPGQPNRPAPLLHGLDVMVLPVQGGRAPVAAGLDAEIEYWLADLGPGVRWIFPAALERALSRSSTFEVPIHALAVTSFHYSQVERIGDPLYGDLRRAGAVAGARYALLPVMGSYVPGEGGEAAPGEGRVELAVALIDTMGGNVLWFGVVAGERGAPDDPAVVASAARELAFTLFPGRR